MNTTLNLNPDLKGIAMPTFVIITPRSAKQLVTKQTKDGFYSKTQGAYSPYAVAKHFSTEVEAALHMMTLRPYYPLAYYANTAHFC